MISDQTNGGLQKAFELAAKLNLTQSLENGLAGITKHARPGYSVKLYQDFAPYSFQFAVVDNSTSRCVFNGGLIFHGNHDGFGTGSAPTFSVSLTAEPGWQIHT